MSTDVIPPNITKYCRTAWAPKGKTAPVFGAAEEKEFYQNWEKSKVAVVGVPFDGTTSFGHSTAGGPYAIRFPSAKRIETFIPKYGKKFYENCPVFDLGDYNLRRVNKPDDKWMDETLGPLRELTDNIIKAGKVPLVLGGEHSITYYTASAPELKKLDPVWLHFDAHLDAKESYDGLKRSHTCPMYWLLEEGHIKGENFIQIGQRQWDEHEIKNVRRFGTTLCEGWKFGYEKNNWHSLSVSKKVHGRTTERNVAITFDIDAYDAALLRCTGTPEPWGLDFPQVNRILQNINPTAKLVYFDMVEVGHDPHADPSFIEGGLAAQTILHMLCQPYVRQIFK